MNQSQLFDSADGISRPVVIFNIVIPDGEAQYKWAHVQENTALSEASKQLGFGNTKGFKSDRSSWLPRSNVMSLTRCHRLCLSEVKLLLLHNVCVMIDAAGLIPLHNRHADQGIALMARCVCSTQQGDTSGSVLTSWRISPEFRVLLLIHRRQLLAA